jgi:hypothetical protein
MTSSGKGSRLFDLPDFDVPQKESPCLSQWSYEEAVRAFEEIADALKLRQQPRLPDGKPKEMFELLPK